MTKIIPVILCGGSGSRLWPLSRENTPKQFLSLMGDQTLLHDTVTRAVNSIGGSPDNIISVTTQNYFKETHHQLSQFNKDASTHLLSEPEAKNTAPAICYAGLYAQQHFGAETALWIMPADHYIEDQQTLEDVIQRAAALAHTGYIITLGMAATRAETGYGYIKVGADITGYDYIQAIDQFVEKPDSLTAHAFVEAGNYVWNSGMFIATAQSLIDNFATHCPDILSTIKQFMREEDTSAQDQIYSTLPSLSFDTAIMEKTTKAAVIPCDIGWSDVGGWNSVHTIRPKDSNNNVIQGQVTAIDTHDCVIQSSSMLVATMGVRNLIIIEHLNSILVADRNCGDSLRKLVETVKESHKHHVLNAPIENRPWGTFKVLSEGPSYKIKELTVSAGGALSLQKHRHRSEFWTVISGEATVTLNNEIQTLTSQQSIHIPQQAIHCLENKGTEPLIIIELQYGDYLGEDDIERF